MADIFNGLVAGTPVTWSASGGDKTLTLTSLGSAAVRAGAKSDSLVNASGLLPELIVWRLESAVGAAATQGREINLRIGESDSATAGTNNPGNLAGTDETLTNGTELLGQLGYVGALVLSNARGTNVQKVWLHHYPRLPHQIPVVHNDSGQTLSGTAGNHSLTAIPYFRKSVT